MLKIRLARFGAKKKPTYRVVVIEGWRARNSRFIEVVGHYNPVAKPAAVSLDHSRIEYWVKNGAQPSDTVQRLIKTNPAPVAQPTV
ncbi:MAG: 30S ribosomal protein S16 [Bryobacterales bacterium]|nr:30S ribosomal protein S16 [Bryobacterales bacterium]